MSRPALSLIIFINTISTYDERSLRSDLRQQSALVLASGINSNQSPTLYYICPVFATGKFRLMTLRAFQVKCECLQLHSRGSLAVFTSESHDFQSMSLYYIYFISGMGVVVAV